MTASAQLPEGFSALEPYVKQWSLRTSAERDHARLTSSSADRETFYAAAQPLLKPALDYLDTFPVKELAGQEQRLMELMMALAHISLAVEVQKEMEAQHARQAAEMPITRSVTDPLT